MLEAQSCHAVEPLNSWDEAAGMQDTTHLLPSQVLNQFGIHRILSTCHDTQQTIDFVISACAITHNRQCGTDSPGFLTITIVRCLYGHIRLCFH